MEQICWVTCLRAVPIPCLLGLKMTLRYHFSPTRVANSKTPASTYWPGCGEAGTPLSLGARTWHGFLQGTGDPSAACSVPTLRMGSACWERRWVNSETCTQYVGGGGRALGRAFQGRGQGTGRGGGRVPGQRSSLPEVASSDGLLARHGSQPSCRTVTWMSALQTRRHSCA